MTMFGLDEVEVSTLVRSVSTEELTDGAAVREWFARAAWSGIAEPGDRLAGLVIARLGAGGALEALVERRPPERLLEALAEGPSAPGEVTVGSIGRSEPSALSERSGSAEATVEELRAALDRWSPRLTSATALIALRQAARFGARLLTPGSALWPKRLADLELHAPIALWCRGTDAALRAIDASIALVGARAATGYGEHVTMEVSAGLVDRGYAVVSGAAYGIDGMAHRAALASRGQTIAFLAGGVDRFYPSGHDALLTRIVESGAVLSELPCGQPPTKWRFLQRNRLIAASTRATVVLEAGWRSGALNTAGHAAALGRALGAVPGPVTSAASAGCHRLIREFDAVLVTTAEQVAELAPLDRVTGRVADYAAEPAAGRDEPADPAPTAAAAPARDPAERTRLFDALSARSPRSAPELAARSGLAVAAVQSLLGGLELEGVVVERERGWVKR